MKGDNMEPTIRDGFTDLGIFENKNIAWTTSRDLARVFDKRHDDVLRQIDRVIRDTDKEWTDRNFAVSRYKDQSGKKNKQYNMTRKGFSLVAMGFTGKKAMEFKVKYIEAFENMFELISSRMLSKNGYKIMTAAIADNIGDDRFIFAEEANRVNRAVLGMSSAEFNQIHGLKNGETPRDAIVKEKLEQIDDAQRLNANLIKAGVNASERARILEVNYKYK